MKYTWSIFIIFIELEAEFEMRWHFLLCPDSQAMKWFGWHHQGYNRILTVIWKYGHSLCKHGRICQNWDRTWPMLEASVMFWPGSGTSRHTYWTWYYNMGNRGWKHPRWGWCTRCLIHGQSSFMHCQHIHHASIRLQSLTILCEISAKWVLWLIPFVQ